MHVSANGYWRKKKKQKEKTEHGLTVVGVEATGDLPTFITYTAAVSAPGLDASLNARDLSETWLKQ